MTRRTNCEQNRVSRQTILGESFFSSFSLSYASSNTYSQIIKDYRGEKWRVILECKIKSGTYESFDHTFGDYSRKKNKPKQLENRMEDSRNAKLIAIWFFKKDFIESFDDYNILKDFIRPFLFIMKR